MRKVICHNIPLQSESATATQKEQVLPFYRVNWVENHASMPKIEVPPEGLYVYFAKGILIHTKHSVIWISVAKGTCRTSTLCIVIVYSLLSWMLSSLLKRVLWLQFMPSLNFPQTPRWRAPSAPVQLQEHEETLWDYGSVPSLETPFWWNSRSHGPWNSHEL